MGVINITPNSFSDGNLFNSIESFEPKFNEACSDFDIIDLGAESTAPFNNPVDTSEELARFEDLLFPVLRSSEDNALTLSIDTYKIDVFKKVYIEVKKYWPSTQIIFNDVSGKIDEELISILNSDLDFSYVFSHNLAPSRTETNKHMEFLTDEDIILHMHQYFLNGLGTLANFNKKIILDPCFGFSKTRQQNHHLLKNLKHVFEGIDTRYDLMYGISRKSFLRFPREMDLGDVHNQKILDGTQALLFNKLFSDIQNRSIILRVHDLNSIHALKNTYSIIS